MVCCRVKKKSCRTAHIARAYFRPIIHICKSPCKHAETETWRADHQNVESSCIWIVRFGGIFAFFLILLYHNKIYTNLFSRIPRTGFLNLSNWKILYWSGKFFAVQDCLLLIRC